MSGTSIHDPTAVQLHSADGASRIAAIIRIIEEPDAPLSPAALEALVRCTSAETKAEQRRAAEALAAAAIHDTRVIGRLRFALGGGSVRSRWGAAYALGRIKHALDVDALPVLVEALSNPDGDVRWAAAELMVRLGAAVPEQVTAEIKKLARDGDPIARRMALYCLRDLAAKGDDLLALAGSCCEQSDAMLRLAALSMVSRLEKTAGAAHLAIRLLKSDPNPGVRRSAAAALGAIGIRSHAVERALRGAVENGSDHSLKRSAEAALRRLGV